MRWIRFTLLVLIILILSAINLWAQRPEPTKTEVHGHTMYGVLPPGSIPAIFKPEFIGIEVAEQSYYPAEHLMVVGHNGETKGYSTWNLDRHEIVNDTISGVAIVATW